MKWLLSLVALGLNLTQARIETLNNENFDTMLAAHSCVLIAFTTAWCDQCKELNPELARAAPLLNPECIVATILADEADNRAIAARYQINSYPTILLFNEDDIL
jgi:thioredoxin-like negative regulator of GroEL